MSYGKRFAIVAALVLLYVALIVSQAFRTVVTDGPHYRERVAGLRVDSVTIAQVRGFIFGDAGEMLAGSLPEYDVYLDFRTTTRPDKKGNMNIPADTITRYFGPGGAGSAALAEISGRRSADEWGAVVRKAYRDRKPHFLLLRAVSYLDYKKLRSLPYFSKSRYLNGISREERAHRFRPFGETRMAAATIGNVYTKDGERAKGHGRSGLEFAYDSLLAGSPGFGYRQKIRRRQVEVTSVEPVNGANVHTTLNVEMQDILDRALARRILQLNADCGWAAVMEVKTGQIKAISNLKRVDSITVVEDYNHLVRDIIEPGSTFKVVSYMALLDNGKITPDKTVDTENHPWQYHTKSIKDDHNVGVVTADEAIVQSSNIAVAKLTVGAYEHDKKGYLEAIERLGLFDDLGLQSDFPGSLPPLRRRVDDPQWSKVSLGQISYGYETQIPGIYLLTFYNAIANNGRMMRPYIVSSIEKDGDVLMERKPTVVKKQICKPATLAAVRHALEGVVERGTASDLRSNGEKKPAAFGGYSAGAKSYRVRIAGKTGTAQRFVAGQKYGTAGHNVSFIGYFPADDPQYTCLVAISRPRKGGAGAGYQVGPVFCQFAEEVYALHCEQQLADITADGSHSMLPDVKRGPQQETQRILGRLRLDSVKVDPIELEPAGRGVMPRVVGMGAEDALYCLEALGLNVTLAGKGVVTAQSIDPGTRIARGSHVQLTLK